MEIKIGAEINEIVKRQLKISIKPKACSLKGYIKLTDLQLDLSRNQERGLKIRNETGDITTDTTEIQRIIRDYE